MKQFNTFLLTLTILCVAPLNSFAEQVEIDGIRYEVIKKGKAATVIQGGNYTGDITIPDSIVYEDVTCYVTSIGVAAFANCHDLTSIKIPNTVTSIEESAFYSCSNLISINIPEGISFIGKKTFKGCIKLPSIVLPNSVTWIGPYAFDHCYELTSINIPEGVTEIGEYAFRNCEKLTSINIPDGITAINGCTFQLCYSLESVILGSGVTNIDGSAFQYCSKLLSIKFPNSTNIIGPYSFQYCSNLKTVEIGSGITYINQYAFANCEELEVVTCKSTKVPVTVGGAFDNSYIEYAKLIVPDESIDSYKESSPWMYFGNIEGISGNIPEKCATPTIQYSNGKVTFECETEGVTFKSSIISPDIKSYNSDAIVLEGTYIVEVYATKEGYGDSDVASAEIQLNTNIQGDIDGDGLINITDVTKIINIILGKE